MTPESMHQLPHCTEPCSAHSGRPKFWQTTTLSLQCTIKGTIVLVQARQHNNPAKSAKQMSASLTELICMCALSCSHRLPHLVGCDMVPAWRGLAEHMAKSAKLQRTDSLLQLAAQRPVLLGTLLKGIAQHKMMHTMPACCCM